MKDDWAFITNRGIGINLNFHLSFLFLLKIITIIMVKYYIGDVL